MYCILWAIFILIFIKGLIVLVRDDSYNNLKHDLIQLKVFNKYYLNYDEIYRNIIETKRADNVETEKLETLFNSLMY